MEKAEFVKKEYCTEILKDAHEDDRICFTSGEGKQFVLINSETLDLMEKQIAFYKFIHELDETRAEADRNGWIEEDDGWRMLGIDD